MKQTVTIWLEEHRIEREGDFYTAYSDQLQLAGCGFTSDDAHQNLDETIITSLRALAKNGMLFKTLEQKRIEYEEVETRKTSNQRPLKPLLVGVS